MAEKNNANIGFEKQIWDAACVLWGHIPAADYRKVIVGLIFLRYISCAFEKRYNALVAEGDGFEDERDAYAEVNVFYVPEEARWSTVAAAAHTPEIGTVIDNAMRAIEKENPSLKNVLPKNYANPDLDKRVLGDVVDLFTNMNMGDTEEGKDLLGRTYEYCIAQFAAYEAKQKELQNVLANSLKTPTAANARLYEGLVQELESLKIKIETEELERSKTLMSKTRTLEFEQFITSSKLFHEFDEMVFRKLVEKVVICEDSVVFKFTDYLEREVPLID